MASVPETARDPERVALFEALFEEHFHYVCRTLRRLGVASADVEDKAHDLFIAVYRRLDQYEPGGRTQTWLFAFALRVASTYRESAHRRREVVSDALVVGAIDARSSSSSDDRRDSQDLVMMALRGIDNLDQRALFIMHELDEVPMKELAETLGIPLSTAHSRLRLARTEFEKAVRRITLKDSHHER